LTWTTASHGAFIIVSHAAPIMPFPMQLSHLAATEKIIPLTSTFP
jgi:hypothetical protein